MKNFILSLTFAFFCVATVRPASAFTYYLTNDTPQGVNALLYESNGVANFTFTSPVNMGGSATVLLTNNIFTNGIAIHGTNNNSLSTLVRLTGFGAIPTGGCNVSLVLSNEFTWWTLPFGIGTAPGSPTNGFTYSSAPPVEPYTVAYQTNFALRVLGTGAMGFYETNPVIGALTNIGNTDYQISIVQSGSSNAWGIYDGVDGLVYQNTNFVPMADFSFNQVTGAWTMPFGNPPAPIVLFSNVITTITNYY